ncbi:MAG: hypothetical protein DRG34_06580 [Deltaproteobacteria bacterium]|nr:MAG: hypothetical protein DRG34_06580 [Deltaproteobacteria bacterium]
MWHGIGYADAIDDILEKRFAPLSRPVIQNMQAVGSRAVGRNAIPHGHYWLAITIVDRDATWSRAQRPLHEMRWNADVVILYQAASFFQNVESRFVIDKDTGALEYIQAGAMQDAALVI